MHCDDTLAYLVVYSTCYPGTEALPQARVLADRTRGTWLPAPVVPGTQPRMVTCRVGAARGGRVAIVILATVPQMIACLYTVPRAASMGLPALAGMRGAVEQLLLAPPLPRLNTSAQCGRGDLGMDMLDVSGKQVATVRRATSPGAPMRR